MRLVPVRIAGDGSPIVVDRARELFGTTHTLADLLRWANGQRPAVQVLAIVTQDEFTHDVVLPLGAAFLSFDTT